MYNTYNPYYIYNPRMNQYQPQYQSQQPAQPFATQTTLQGKSVDSLDVVKAMDIPLDR